MKFLRCLLLLVPLILAVPAFADRYEGACSCQLDDGDSFTVRASSSNRQSCINLLKGKCLEATPIGCEQACKKKPVLAEDSSDDEWIDAEGSDEILVD